MLKSVVKLLAIVLCVFSLSSCSNETSVKGDESPEIIPKATIMFDEGPKVFSNYQETGSYYIDSNSNLWSWGRGNLKNDDVSTYRYNDVCQLGFKCIEDQLTPFKILENVAYFRPFFTGGVALKNDKTLWTWGENNFGVLGTGLESNEAEPVKILDDVIYFTADYYKIYALKDDYSLWSWGADNQSEASSPELILEEVKFIDYSYGNTLVIKTDNSIWGWGDNENGELGVGTTSTVSEPTKIMNNAIFVDIQGGVSLAIKEDNSLWIWGSVWDNSGKRDEKYYEPLKIMDGVIKAYADSSGYFAIKTNGDLYAWGTNIDVLDENYNLDSEGIYDMTSDLIDQPTKILSDVVEMKRVFGLNAVLKTDNSLWVWGGDLSDESTGLGFREYYPFKLFDNVKDFALNGETPRFGTGHILVLTVDDKLFALGRNKYGQLGNGSTDSTQSFIEISTDE